MSFPTEDEAPKLFQSHFRAASPIPQPESRFQPQITPNPNGTRQSHCPGDNLSNFGRADSFSSISSCGQREQFRKAYGSLQKTILTFSNPSNMENHPTSSIDSDPEFVHLDAPDPEDMARYQAGQTMSSQETSPAHVPHERQNRDLDDFLNDLDRGHVQHGQHEDNLGQARQEYLSKDRSDDLLVDLASPASPERHPEQHERDHLEHVPQHLIDDLFANPPVQHEERRPTPPAPSNPSPVEDVQDFVNEVLPEPIRHSPLTDDRRHIEDEIESAVNDTHDEVDAIIERLNSASPPGVPEQNSPSEDSGRDELGGLIGDGHGHESQIPVSDSLSSGLREASPDEHTFDRRGPLTIPDTTHSARPVSPPEDEAPTAPPANDDDYEPVSPAHSHFDDLPPRPPTPPKDLSDEDVQPEAIDLGPPAHVHAKSPEKGLKPILKHDSAVGPWFDFRSVDPRVLDIIYWRDPKKSGAALGAILVGLFLVTKFSLISLLAYGSLAVLVGTLGFRVFKLVEAQIKKTESANPFKPYLEHELDVPQERVHAQVDVFVEHGRELANQLRRLFLVENIVDSVKFGLLLWTLTYVGAWFSGFGLIILFIIGVFTVPKVYEIYKEPIDNYLGMARENVDKVHAMAAEKLPFLNKQATTTKKEE